MSELFNVSDVVIMEFNFYFLTFISLLTLGFYIMDRKSYKVKYLFFGNVSYLLMHASVLLSINGIVKLPPMVGFFEMVAVTLYACAFFDILNHEIPYKNFIVVNVMHLILIWVLWPIVDQVSLLRMVTALFTVYLIIYAMIKLGLQKRIVVIKSFGNVFANVSAFLVYKFVLIIFRLITSNYEVGIESIKASIVVFSFILLLLILWNNFTIMFLNYDRLNAQYRHLSFNDYLTNIPNRRYAVLRLNEALTQAKSEDLMFGVFLLDINGFKYFNDTYGHDFGDKILVEFTNKMKSLIRNEDLFARYGGDEFLLMFKIKNNNELDRFVNRIQMHFNHNTITDRLIKIKFAFGKTTIDSSTKLTLKQLIQLVDKKLYESKEMLK